MDQALGAVGSSSAQGQALLRASTPQPSITAQAVVGELARVATQASTTYRTMSTTAAPPGLQTAAGLLDAALLARRNGSEEMATAAHNALFGGHPSVAASEMSAAVSDFQVGDSAYKLFAGSSTLGVRLPASQWVPPGSYGQAALAAFVQRLTTGATRSPRQPLVIDAVSTNPAPLNLAGTVEVLSPSSTLDVTVDLTNLAHSPLDGVTVTAALAPAYGSSGQQMSSIVTLTGGQSLAVALPALSPQLSAVSTLTVTASAPSGTSGPVRTSLRLVVPGPGFKGVPKNEQGTTTTAPATTTVPGLTAPAATTTTPLVTTTAASATTSTRVLLSTTTPPSTTTTSLTTTTSPTTTTRTTTTRTTTTASKTTQPGATTTT